MYINTYISSINNAFYSEMACSLSDYLLTLHIQTLNFIFVSITVCGSMDQRDCLGFIKCYQMIKILPSRLVGCSNMVVIISNQVQVRISCS